MLVVTHFFEKDEKLMDLMHFIKKSFGITRKLIRVILVGRLRIRSKSE